MNIVYGFGGLRSDKKTLSLSPMILDKWNKYSFKINYQDAHLKINVDKEKVVITNKVKKVSIKVYYTLYEISDQLIVELK